MRLEKADSGVCLYMSFTKTADKQMNKRANERQRQEGDKMKRQEKERAGYEKRQSRGVKRGMWKSAWHHRRDI